MGSTPGAIKKGGGTLRGREAILSRFAAPSDGITRGGDPAEAHREYGEMIASSSEQEQTPLRNQLLEYCERDTYAMVQIHRRLREMVGEPG